MLQIYLVFGRIADIRISSLFPPLLKEVVLVYYFFYKILIFIFISAENPCLQIYEIENGKRPIIIKVGFFFNISEYSSKHICVMTRIYYSYGHSFEL